MLATVAPAQAQRVNRGLPARMVKFAGEGHGLSDPANQRYAAQEQISWFRTDLMNDE